jgi:Ca-activated chloride channel homolog
MPKITSQLSRSVLHNQQDSQGRSHDTILRIQIQAPPSRTQAQQRTPLNIGIVIDRSGSMAGQKLHDAIEATKRIINRLNAQDRCAIVTFDNQAALLADSLPVTSAQRLIIDAALSSVQSGGSTNISDGWQMAVERLQKNHSAGTYLSRVLLLTDGRANQGIRAADQLANLAAMYGQQGISLSTYGLGLHYNEELLDLLAQHGLGNHHFIAQSSDIDGYFQHELSEMFGVVMQRAELIVTIPANMQAEVVGHAPHHTEGQRITIPLGALVHEEQRTIYVRLSAPHMHPVGEYAGTVMLQGQLEDGQSTEITSVYQVQMSADVHVRNMPADRQIEHEAALIDLAWVRAEASRLNASRDFGRASDFVMSMHQRSTIYAQFDIYTSLAHEMGQWRDEMTRKRSMHSKNLSSRFSTKDLSILRAQYDRLVASNAPMSEIMELKQLIDMLEEWLRRRQ